jgi:hypothetical protein
VDLALHNRLRSMHAPEDSPQTREEAPVSGLIDSTLEKFDGDLRDLSRRVAPRTLREAQPQINDPPPRSPRDAAPQVASSPVSASPAVAGVGAWHSLQRAQNPKLRRRGVVARHATGSHDPSSYRPDMRRAAALREQR